MSEQTAAPAQTTLEELMQKVADLQAKLDAQTPAEAPTSYTKADGYDESDNPDTPMVVFDQKLGTGEVVRHRVKVSEWPAYERRFGF